MSFEEAFTSGTSKGLIEIVGALVSFLEIIVEKCNFFFVLENTALVTLIWKLINIIVLVFIHSFLPKAFCECLLCLQVGPLLSAETLKTEVSVS